MSNQIYYCPNCHSYTVTSDFHNQTYSCQKCGIYYKAIPTPPLVRWLLIASSVFLFVSFVGFGLPSIVRLILLPQSSSWPTAQGIIQTADIQAQSSARTGAVTYVPIAQYKYLIRGKVYMSNRIRINPWGYLTKETAEEEIRSYSPGQVVIVHYFPLIPSYSYLQRGYITVFLFIEVGIGIFLFVSSVSSLIIGISIGNPRFWQRRKQGHRPR